MVTNMIIDFHTHTFPDRIAKATIKKLSECPGITPHTDGTAAGLKRSMEEKQLIFAENARRLLGI